MLRTLAIVFISAALLTSTGTGGAADIRLAESRSLALNGSSPPSAAPHTLRIHAYMFAGTQWRAEDIELALAHAAVLISQCDVAVASADLHTIEAPERYHHYATPRALELLSVVGVQKPAVFFVQDTLNRPAYDAEAIGIANAATRAPLANTVWVAYGAKDLAQALAHELVHVLSDSGAHSDEPGNLMQPETSPSNTRLTTAQCERMRSRGVDNGLLQAR
jgi:hypothetical protein